MWFVDLDARAARELRKLDRSAQQRVAAALDALAVDPFAGDVKPLKGKAEATYRRREGDYRIIFQLQADKVLVLAIGHRREIYR